MDTVRYRAFVTAAEKGTIKEAAEEMGYTSSAISQLIKALEEELDTELLVRSRTGVTLTSGGATLLPVARMQFHHVSSGEKDESYLHSGGGFR